MRPFTVSATAYAPGRTSGPSGSRGVRPGIAEIGYSRAFTGGAGYRRSHTHRWGPGVAGRTRAGRAQSGVTTSGSTRGSGASSLA